jgi:hypothetical protein
METPPEGVSFLLADVLLGEASCSDNPALFMEKLDRFLKLNVDRIHLAFDWSAIVSRETTPSSVSISDLLHEEATSELRSGIRTGFSLVDALGHTLLDRSNGEHELRRARFVKLCLSFSAWANGRRPEWIEILRAHPSARVAWIRSPDLVADFVARRKPSYSTPQWRSALRCFPDRCAVGRWGRIVAWYALQQAIKPDRREANFENDWDDAEYAFLASYTGLLATEDRGLMGLVAAVFPQVSVIQPSV